jgi:asparagine synthase (glutamine-hydrolysing)
MRDTMTHGGPDDAGAFYSEGGRLALTHRRLSIIDLSPLGHQPMIDENFTIVFNGEIYNYAEIKSELIARGYNFRSSSDTEVVLKAYREWGTDCVCKFRGMWAFALWDEKEKTLTLSRDRLGVKPLYWYYKDGLFMFSSELKAFHEHPAFDKKLDFKALSLYLQHGYIASPLSIFANTYKLEPGNFLKIDARRNIKKIEYWSPEKIFLDGFDARERGVIDEERAADELEELLLESFKLRMVSDVPVGMFLSGGVDSSLLTALLAKDGGYGALKTFTIGFDEKEYDEAKWAKKVAEHLKTEHTELYCRPSDAFDIIAKLPLIYDEPLGDASAVPTYLVSKLARTKVKVSLSADGGDEQFCGYNRYFMINDRIAKFSNNPFLSIISGALDYVSAEAAYAVYDKLSPILPRWNNFYDKFTKLKKVLKTKKKIAQYDLSNKYFLEEDIARLGIGNISSQLFKFDERFEKMNILDQMMYLDIKTYLPDDILVKVDRAAMSVALEGRDPFLDHKITEFAARLPLELKYKNGVSKYILKKILYRHVPRELVDRPKQGFGVPVYEWFRDELKGCYADHLAFDKIKREGIFDAGTVSALLDGYLNDRGVNAYKLWFLFVFELWYEKYMA